MQKIKMMIAFLSILSTYVVLFGSAAEASTIIRTVGAVGCDYSEIQPAIDFMATQPAGARKIIRIASDKLYDDTALSIEELSVTLDGRFDTCASPSPGEARSILRGDAASPVIEILSLTSSSRVQLRGLSLSRGNGGIKASGPVEISAEELTVKHNRAAIAGGGISLESGAHLIFRDLTFARNQADFDGGAIYCNGGKLTGLGGSLFVENVANHVGGAIFNRCAGTELTGRHTFLTNRASLGGAIGSLGSGMWLRSRVRGDIEIRDNRATETGAMNSLGGGIAVLGGSVVAFDTVIEGNSVAGDPDDCGGGVAVAAGVFSLLSSGTLFCDGGSCSSLKGNEGAFGAALCVHPDGTGEISDTRIEGNGDIDGDAASNILDVEGGSLLIRDSILVGNRSPTLIDVQGSGSALVVGSTIAENHDTERLMRVGVGSVGELYGSIFWQPPALVFAASPSATIDAECVLANDLSTLPPHDFSSSANPRFVDGPAGEFRLSVDSPAIDFCDPVAVPLFSERDFDGGTRGLDDPQIPDHFAGAYFDIGADEYGSQGFLRFDDFESGDLSTWDHVVF